MVVCQLWNMEMAGPRLSAKDMFEPEEKREVLLSSDGSVSLSCTVALFLGTDCDKNAFSRAKIPAFVFLPFKQKKKAKS